jgi:hypothetical protein
MPRKRSDSATQAVAATQAAIAGTIQPPEHVYLRERDWPYWEAIVQARAADTWNDADLALAANLARCQSDIDRLQKELDDTGDILNNAKGTPVVNPRHALLETLSRRVVALSRVVHVHAEATKGRSRDGGNKTNEERGKRAAVEAMRQSEDAGLIPGLTLQ